MARIKLSEVVGNFLDLYNYGEAEYSKAYRLAIRGLKQIDWDVTGVPERIKVPVNGDLTVKIPENVIKVLSVGILNDKGELTTLTYNKRLTELCYDDDEEYESNTYLDQAHSDFSTYPSYSLGVGSYRNIGEYRYDKSGGLIILSTDFCHSYVVLECLVRELVDGEYTIHPMASEALLYFIVWQWSLGRRGATGQEKEQNRRDYFNELHKAKVRIKRPSVQEMKQLAKQQTKGGVRS